MGKVYKFQKPFRPQSTVRGKDLNTFIDLVSTVSAKVYEGAWKKCEIRSNSPAPSISIHDGVEVFLLGPIGLEYLAYRFRDNIDAKDIRLFYRNGRYKELSNMLNLVMKERMLKGLHRDTYYFTYIESELMGICTQYTAVTNLFISSVIQNVKLEGRVNRWLWRPTEARINLKGGIVKKMFQWGVQILNGETGHRALAFRSVLWTPSLDGFTYEFHSPLRDTGYARHMPTKKLVNVIAGLENSLKENMLAEAFEQFDGMAAGFITKTMTRRLDEAKARETTKEKVSITFDDDVDIYGPDTALDAITLLLEGAARINKSAAVCAQDVVNQCIAELMKLPRKPGGEVIADES